MKIARCDVCGVTSDERLPFPEQRDWRRIEVLRASDWMPRYESAGPPANAVREKADNWPGNARWDQAWPNPLHIDACSEDCMLEGLQKLHEGARIVGFAGFSLETKALWAAMRVSTEFAA